MQPEPSSDRTKPRMLLTLPIVPWPVRRNGISLRFAPIIDYLAQRYELDLLVLAEEYEPLQLGGPLQRCRAVDLIKVPVLSLPPWLRKIRSACYSLSPFGAPAGSLGYAHRRLERLVLDYLEHKNYAAVVWATRHLGIACRIRRRYPGTRFVVDLVDSPTLCSFRDASSNLFIRGLVNYNGWKWHRLERQAQQVFDAAIYISSVDARAVGAAHQAQVHVVPNGIFHADAPPLTGTAFSGKTIGFLGDLTYQPNVSAVLRLAQRIFPRILAAVADARLLIIGREPPAAVQRLQGPAISVTGTVDNIWPYVTRASVFAFPMIEGAGLQNKILEAMYACIPVVTTPIAADGIGATSSQQLLVADTDDEIAAHVVRLLCDPSYAAGLAQQARTFVMREFSWPAILPRYHAIVAPPALRTG
jgi:glycosyltransferase involved in cell wall biosynthesis